MKEDAENRRWYAQQLAEKKMRGECVFAIPTHNPKDWFCRTHGCPIVARLCVTAIPTYVCSGADLVLA